MTEAVNRLKPELEALSEPERAELAFFLLQTLDQDEDPGYEAAWEAEIARRVADYKSGRSITVPAAQVFAELREKYS